MCKIIFVGICGVVLTITLTISNPIPVHNGYAFFDGVNFEMPKRPDEPRFPVPSLRISALGDDFLGIISDMETDILINPSLLPLLKSNYLNFTYYKNLPSLTILFPKTFISSLAVGFHNQLNYSGTGYYHKYYYDDYLNSPSYLGYSLNIR
ncbi:MAG: hypothetical protein N2201_03945 [candidate division WOR-3 bacterium]|nr:hypothetical protein [candidate division WOR-3 bacterium]